MFIELQWVHNELRKWKNKEISLSVKEVLKLKEFLKKNNPTSYYRLFSEEEDKNEKIRL